MSEQQTPDQFAVGEIAIYWKPNSPNHGKEVTILSPLHLAILVNTRTGTEAEAWAYTIDPPSDWVVIGAFNDLARRWCVRPEFLRKKKPPREDLRVTRWSECPWQPQQVRA